MVYQGIIDLGKSGGHLWVVWLVVAVFGSALTLASFVKLLHSVFLGVREKQGNQPKEVGFAMALPMLALALVTLVFGIFAYALPLKAFIVPAVDAIPSLRIPDTTLWPGWWSAGLATMMILAGIAIGLVIYSAGRLRKVRVDSPYIGGEVLPGEARVTGTGFYNTITDMGLFRGIYGLAEKKVFDIYDVGKAISFYVIRGLRALHSGNLPDYLTWALAGWLIIMVILLR
jgi:NADH:ubiquinone oxidoreductase subunit 5 (subunit L)/multisubunit Na+/H+ antiporter MnhA subunit